MCLRSVLVCILAIAIFCCYPVNRLKAARFNIRSRRSTPAMAAVIAASAVVETVAVAVVMVVVVVVAACIVVAAAEEFVDIAAAVFETVAVADDVVGAVAGFVTAVDEAVAAAAAAVAIVAVAERHSVVSALEWPCHDTATTIVTHRPVHRTAHTDSTDRIY